MDIAKLSADLAEDEGVRLRMYQCPAGANTIGVGHNLDAKPITRRAAMVILEDDIADAAADLDRNIPWWRTMTEARQRALCNMCFQLGWPRLAGFRRMLAALQAGRWAEAAHEAQDSNWYRQTQASRTSRIIRAFQEG